MKSPRRWAVLGLVCVVLGASEATVLGDPGFGLIKKRKVDLQVRKPAAVRLANTSIAFRSRPASLMKRWWPIPSAISGWVRRRRSNMASPPR